MPLIKCIAHYSTQTQDWSPGKIDQVSDDEVVGLMKSLSAVEIG